MIRFGAGCFATASLGVLLVPAGAVAAADPLKPAWTSGLTVKDDFETVIAPDRKNAWAFGATYPDSTGRPLAYRKSGPTWKRDRLPRGLKGSIEAASASSADNVWAVGSDLDRARDNTYLLHWNGERWRFVRRWKALIASTVIATGDRGVWVFDYLEPQALHYDGRRWHQIKTPISILNAAARGKTIWAVGQDRTGRAKAARFDGARWKVLDPAPLPPQKTGESLNVLGTPVIRDKAVWMSGVHIPDLDDEEMKGTESFLLRYGNGRWHKEKTSPYLPINLDALSDGRGGLWSLAYTEIPPDTSFREELFLTRRSATGHWSRRLLGKDVNGTLDVFDAVRIPGTQRFLAVGLVDPPGRKSDAAVFEFS